MSPTSNSHSVGFLISTLFFLQLLGGVFLQDSTTNEPVTSIDNDETSATPKVVAVLNPTKGNFITNESAEIPLVLAGSNFNFPESFDDDKNETSNEITTTMTLADLLNASSEKESESAEFKVEDTENDTNPESATTVPDQSLKESSTAAHSTESSIMKIPKFWV